MRLEALRLIAFGPFTDVNLDLSGGSPGGVHVIYGPNEAGKSTSLRAVTGLFFGIPHQSADAHLHPSSKLCVGAEISDGDERFFLTRLKRRKDDLVDENGQALVENPLPALLGNIDEHSFRARFGLDQVELERGAEALLGGSEQGLFAAGTAGAEVREVLDSLARTTEEIYRPRGSKPLLNRALLEYERATRDARRAERPPEKWLEQKRAHEQALALVVERRQQRDAARAELRRLNRLRAILSDLVSWEAASTRLTSLGEEPALPPDASEQRQKSEQRLAEAQVELRHLGREIARLEAELRALPPESSLPEVDDEQMQLSTRVGTALSARKDLPKRQASLLEQVRQVKDLLSELGRAAPSEHELEYARGILPKSRSIAQVRTLATEQGGLLAAWKAAERAHGVQEKELARLEEERAVKTPTPSDLAEWEAIITDAQAEQPLLLALSEDETELNKLQLEAGKIRASLGVRLPWRELSPLLLSREAAERRVRQHDDIHRMRLQMLESLRKCEKSQQELLEQVSAEEAAGLPSEEQLPSLRRRRDELLSAIQSDPTPEDFEQLRCLISEADELSDQLRADANRLVRVANLRREAQKAQAQMVEMKAELDHLEDTERDVQRRHEEYCEKIGVISQRTVPEASRTLEQLSSLVQWESQIEAKQILIAERRARISWHEQRIRRSLSVVPESAQLPGLIVTAAREHRQHLQEVERGRQAAAALQRARKSFDQAKLDRAQAAERLSRWQAEWAEAVTLLGLPPGATVAVALEALGAFEKLGRVLQEANALEGRIKGMERDTRSLENDVRSVLRRHLPELLEMDPVDAAVELQEQIRIARRASEERARFRNLLAERRQQAAKVEATIASAEAQLSRLVQQAGVDDASQLPMAEERKREILSLKEEVKRCELSIREKAEGLSMNELREEANAWMGRASILNQRVYDLEEKSEELDEEYRAAESEEASIRLGLSVYSSEEVVDARQRATSKAAEARSHLRFYLVNKAAEVLLRRQMEAYAERFAGPILGRASDLFQALTLGRYERLSVGTGGRTLRCVRGQQEVEVTELSRGTRAQLYFALRLASLEVHFQDSAPLPLIFDDLFVDFDDDRARAAFEVLSELATKVQVLYFTHLARDVEAAHDAVPRGLLFEHRLAAS